jgi:hypothetical protein
MAGKKKKDKIETRRRQERRFVAQSAFNPWIVRVLGGLGALALGAGAWGYFYGHLGDLDEKFRPIPSYLIAAGAVLTGVAIWLGTSSETPIRVGAPGIGVEHGDLRRMPWWSVKKIVWESGSLSLVVSGNDEAGTSWTFKVPLKVHPEAVAWIVKEATQRVPKAVDVPDSVLDKLPEATNLQGMRIDLEPLQVVGKKCAASGKAISYEPDARVCARCERVYFKRSVPKKCKCGAGLDHLRNAVQDADADDEESDGEDGGDVERGEPAEAAAAEREE